MSSSNDWATKPVKPNRELAAEAVSRTFFQVTATQTPMIMVSKADLTYLVIMASLWLERDVA